MKNFVKFGLILLGATSLAFASANSEVNIGEDIYKKCAGCHGLKGEKKALNKSAAISEWDEEKIFESLKGYKDGTYGGPMKGLMKGQVMAYSETELKSLSTYIYSLNNTVEKNKPEK